MFLEPPTLAPGAGANRLCLHPPPQLHTKGAVRVGKGRTYIIWLKDGAMALARKM